jgi:hypothetical protein
MFTLTFDQLVVAKLYTLKVGIEEQQYLLLRHGRNLQEN